MRLELALGLASGLGSGLGVGVGVRARVRGEGLRARRELRVSRGELAPEIEIWRELVPG